MKVLGKHLDELSHTPTGEVIENFQVPYAGTDFSAFKPQTQKDFNLKQTDRPGGKNYRFNHIQ